VVTQRPYICQFQWRTLEIGSGGGGSTNLGGDRGQRAESRDRGAVAPYPLVKGSGSSCNLVQEFSFHIVKVS